MFLKLEKVHLESSRYRKTTLDISVSDHLSIYAYLFLFKSKAIECFLENIVPENMFSFPDLFFSHIVFVKCFTAIVLVLSATLLKVEVLNRLASNRNNT